MFDVNGKYTSATIFTENIDEKAIGQIIELCNQEFMNNSKVRIMPDVHAGAGCTIGTTITICDKVVPNLVGVDIGCGMETIELKEKEIDFQKLDEVIRRHIPSGMTVREDNHKNSSKVKIDNLKCKKHININRAYASIGTLGGGNHFIEINKDSNGKLYLVIHSGSRNLGKQVAEYYQELAYKKLTDNKTIKDELIKKLLKEGREKDIQKELSKIPTVKIQKSLAYLEGDDFKNYLHDMNIVQEFATINRQTISEEILKNMGLTAIESFTTIHNYIELESMILRKGAISSKDGEKVLIPINMRDGSLICAGKGNPEWNYSAPHGAGRILSRGRAKECIKLEDFEDTMKGIWTTSVCESTIDESPFAYKPMEDIVNNISDTVNILDIIKPLYNFKAN